MELRKSNNDQKLILNQESNFMVDLGWSESFQSFEDEVLSSIINPIENYETVRFIHKPYISNITLIQQTDIWFYFYFSDGDTHSNGLNYGRGNLYQTESLTADVKNSFFRLEFYKTKNDELPNRSNRKFVFAKNLSVPLGQKTYLTDINDFVYLPVFTGSNYKNKENMYLFWFYDDTVLEETEYMSDIFYVTARFYNANDGSRLNFANQSKNSEDINEETDLYYKMIIERSPTSGDPSFNYSMFDLNTNQRVGTLLNPINFYSVGSVTVALPTLTPTATPAPTPTATEVVTPTPTPTPSPTVGAATATWSVGTQVIASTSTIQPDIETITGSVTITNGSMTFTITSTKSFNYGNESTGVLNVSGIGVITATCISGASTQTSYGTLTLPIGTYSYTLTAEIEILGTTSGNAITNIIQI